MCPCGKPLHYSDIEIQLVVEKMIDELGEYTDVTTPDGTWRVSRHYIALHGIKANELPDLGFERTS